MQSRIRDRLTPEVWAVLAFSALYVSAAAVTAPLTGNLEFVFYVAVLVVLAGAVGAMHLRVGLSVGVLWGLSIWGLLHMAGGLVPVPESWPTAGEFSVLYSLWLIPGRLKFDHVVHAYGFGVAAWVCWEGMRAATGVSRPTPGMLLLCALGAMGLGALNEIVEFAATLLLPETNVGGYRNTGWDLVANAIGATTAVVVLSILHRSQR